MIGGIFWATALIILGILMIFGANAPIFRVGAGALLIYFGVQVTNQPSPNTKAAQTFYFSKRTINIDDIQSLQDKGGRYAVLFGSSTIDLSNIESIPKENQPVHLNINTIFGNTIIKLNKNIPTKVISNSAFGKTEFPDETEISFGNYAYENSSEKAHLIINSTTIFGKLTITETTNKDN